MELLLSSVGDDENNIHIKGVWAHIGFIGHDYLGFLVKRCSFETQFKIDFVVKCDFFV